jgi:hypothetical protein
VGKKGDEALKGEEFAQLLSDFSEVLGDKRAAPCRAFLPIFGAAPTSTVVKICGVLSGVQAPGHGRGPRLHEMIGLLSALKRLLNRASAKKQVLDDLEAVSTTLRPFEQVATEAFADAAVERLREQRSPGGSRGSAVRDDLVQSYLQRLEEALSDETRFTVVFDELKKDASIKASEAKRLSKAFAKETAKSRGTALDLIWARHAALMGARARQQANKGRTAA